MKSLGSGWPNQLGSTRIMLSIHNLRGTIWTIGHIEQFATDRKRTDKRVRYSFNYVHNQSQPQAQGLLSRWAGITNQKLIWPLGKDCNAEIHLKILKIRPIDKR